MGDDHEHHDHDPAGEEFPRLEVAKLVGQEGSGERGAVWPTWLVTLGLFALALGLPTERVLGELTHAGATRGLPVLGGLTARLATFAELDIERAGYLLAAITWALSLPAMIGLLRTIGFGTLVALSAALVVMLAPAAWIGATLPSAFGAQLLGATLLAWALFAARTSRIVYLLRALAVFAFAFCLHPAAALLAPALLWALLTQEPAPAPGAWRDEWTIGLPVIGTLALVYLAGPMRFGDLFEALSTPAERSQFMIWLAWVPVAAGTALLGFYGLFFARRAPEESPPPRWLTLWCVALAVPLFLASPTYALWGAGLLPAAAIDLADWTTRESRPGLAGPRVGVLLGLQIALTLAAVLYLAATDEYREWRAVAREQLEPTDFVLTFDERREYYLKHRFGLESRDISPAQELDGVDLLSRGPEFPPELWRIEREFQAWTLALER